MVTPSLTGLILPSPLAVPPIGRTVKVNPQPAFTALPIDWSACLSRKNPTMSLSVLTLVALLGMRCSLNTKAPEPRCPTTWGCKLNESAKWWIASTFPASKSIITKQMMSSAAWLAGLTRKKGWRWKLLQATGICSNWSPTPSLSRCQTARAGRIKTTSPRMWSNAWASDPTRSWITKPWWATCPITSLVCAALARRPPLNS